MHSLDTVAVGSADRMVTLREVLWAEHCEGRLEPLLRHAARNALLVDRARAFSLRVELSELQSAADRFRRERNLLGAEQTRVWLAERRLREDDLEAMLEESLLRDKLRDHVGKPGVEARFAANASDYDRLVLRIIVVPREDAARELISQIAEEGASMADLARRYSVDASREHGGHFGPLFRKQLPVSIQEAVSSAGPGLLDQPLQTEAGFMVVQIEQITPAQLDQSTSSAITQDLFDEWLAEQCRQSPLSLPLLEILAIAPS